MKGDGLIHESDDPSFDTHYVLRFKRFDEMHRAEMEINANAKTLSRSGDKFIEWNLIGTVSLNTTNIFFLRITICVTFLLCLCEVS